MFRPKHVVFISLIVGSFGFIWLMSRCNTGTWCDDYEKMIKVKDRLEKIESELELRRRELERRETILGVSQPMDTDNMPTIYAITPTYTRHTQKADLTRLSQTFLHIPKFHWIIVEDANNKTQLVANFLKDSGMTYVHLAIRTPQKLIRGEDDPRWLKARGVEQRNLGLKWVREHFDPDTMEGVVYFVDDDNTYDLKIFEQMRYTKKVSVWPVGLVGGLRWEGPICENGRVKKFYTAWKPERPFPLDMAGFAINAKLIKDKAHVNIDPDAKRGYLESSLLKQLVSSKSDVEPLADNCKKILVWHTQTAEPNMKQEKRLQALGKGSDPSIEV